MALVPTLAKSPLVRKLAAGLFLSAAGLAMLQLHEGTVYVVYLDIAGVPTDCTGNTKGLTRADVGKVRSKEYCERVDRANFAAAEAAVKRHVKVPLTQEQYDSLVDWTFNLGEGALASSTMLKRINAGQCWQAADAMDDWDKAVVRGVLRPVQGLTKRRYDNRLWFEAGCK